MQSPETVLPARGRKARRRAPALLAAASAFVMLTATDSAAARTDNIVPTFHYINLCTENGGLCQTDNADLTYYMDSGGGDALEESDKNRMRTMLKNEYSPTDLKISYDSTPSWSGAAETDIYYAEGAVSGSAVGISWCNDAIARTYKCDQNYIRIESAWMDYSTMCHETGHAVGLTHGNIADPPRHKDDPILGCMTVNVNNSDLGANNKANINSVY
ncbi:hypothetical protein ACFWIA_05715 [Streptomyces sp. NPDC127068]|uniref:hypothetical protein n=1 Tax=Streptomyces sp. NPDC127068 TaxID=3347127 RepID=UPI00366861C7